MKLSILLILIFAAIQQYINSQTITDFWNEKQTYWKFISESNFGGSMNVGTFFVPINQTWFLFYRQYGTIPSPESCVKEKKDVAKIILTWSEDKGQSWAAPIDVAVPNPQNEYEDCAHVDGGAFFDKETNTWHYLSQCLGSSKSWAICHFYRKDPDPRGNWTEDPLNPVIVGGQLFKEICKDSLVYKKHCSVLTKDEGTPDIVEKVNGDFYVTFHGYDYVSKRAVRGVAATKDFVNWRVTGSDLPDDAIFSYQDCNKWNVSWANNTCVGGGEGTTVVGDDGYKYMIIESPDISLTCDGTPGVQNWVIGLVRSQTWAQSDKWESFSANPMLVPWRKQGCAIQYHRLFFDSYYSKYYLAYWIFDGNTGGLKVFELNDGQESLPLIADPYTPNYEKLHDFLK